MEKVKVKREIYNALISFEERVGDLKSNLNYYVCRDYYLSENEKILRKVTHETLVDIAY